MDSIGGMSPTGRRISGPASELVELDSDSGLKHTAIRFNEAFLAHAGITSSLTVVLGFLESPMVTGLVELVHHDRDTGSFVYPTGTVWSVAEVIRTMANAGRTPGIRAGLELCYVAGQVLMEASESGPAQGIYSHGGLTPWRLMLKADGQVQIVGYGLPQVEILDYLDDNSVMPREDSFRYCPPERLEGQGEDVTSDLFSLALIGLEMMVGKPVYDGLVDDILQKATRAEGAYTLYKWREELPDSVREVLGRAIKYDPDTRYEDPNDFVHDVHDILSSVDAEGPSLMEVMDTVRRAPKRGRALMGGQTQAISKEQLKRLAEEVDDAGGRGVSPPKRPRAEEIEEDPEGKASRWTKVSRKGRRGGDDEPEPAASSPRGAERSRGRRARGGEEASPRDRLRRSRGGDEEKASPRERLRRSRSGDSESPRDRLRRSRGAPEEDSSATPRAGGDKRAGRERLRRSRGAEEEEPAARPERPRRKRNEPEPASGAAELLAKLRSSSGVATKPEKPSEGLQAPPTQEDQPSPAAAPVAAAPAPAPPLAPAPPPTPAPSPAPTPSAALEGSEPAGPTVEVQVGGTTRELQVEGSSVSEVAMRWTTQLGLPCDLAGRLSGWYAIEQEGALLDGAAAASAINMDGAVALRYLANDCRVVTIRAGEHRFKAPVGMATPAASLLAHLVGWLGLSAGTRLAADGKELHAAQVLAEAAPSVEVLEVMD